MNHLVISGYGSVSFSDQKPYHHRHGPYEFVELGKWLTSSKISSVSIESIRTKSRCCRNVLDRGYMRGMRLLG